MCEGSRPSHPLNVTDAFDDVLQNLSPQQRLALNQYIADAYYLYGRNLSRQEMREILNYMPSVSGRRRRTVPTRNDQPGSAAQRNGERT